MAPVVVALLLGSLWLAVRAARIPRGVDDTREAHAARRRRAWLLAVTCVALAGWFAVEQLVVGSGDLARTVDRVHVASAPDRVPGPLGLLAATELALDTDLRMTEVGQDALPTRRTTSYEISDRLLGVRVGTACVVERLVGDAADGMRSYQVTPGRCG